MLKKIVNQYFFMVNGVFSSIFKDDTYLKKNSNQPIALHLAQKLNFNFAGY